MERNQPKKELVKVKYVEGVIFSMEEKAISNALNFSLTSWFKDKKSQKYLAALLIITGVSFITAMLLMGNIYSDIGAIAEQGTPDQSQIVAIISSIMGAIVAIVTISFVISFIELAVLFLASARALEIKKFKPIQIDFGNYVMLIVLGIVQAIAILISLMNLKLLWVLIGGIAAFILGAILVFVSPVPGALLLLISFLLIAAYAFIMIYNSIRLAFCGVAFIEKERGIMESLQESWDRTEGSVWNVLIALIVFFVVIIIIVYAASIPSTVYSQMYLVGLGVSDAEGPAMLAGLGGLFSNPIYLILSIPTLIAGAWTSIIGAFYMVSIYDSLKPRKTAAKPKKTISKAKPKKRAEKPKKKKK